MSKIIRLQSTNYKRLKAVEITPDGNIVTIGGNNGAGKSSVLDSITAALGGVNSKSTPKPIRDGEDHAEIVLETDELIVTRRFTPSGSNLTVTTPDGAKFPRGQAKLDDLLSKLSLDPLAFTQLSEKQQLDTLLGLVDLPFDPTDLDAQRNEFYEQRTEIGRQGKAIGAAEVDESLPEQESSASELLQQIRKAQEHNTGITQAQDRRQQLQATITQLQEQLQAAQAEHDSLANQVGAELVDIDEMEQRLSTIEATNAKIRSNNEARQQQGKKEQLRGQYQQLTEQIEQLEQSKADGLAAAQMPVDGLGLDAHGVTFEGIPFKQINTASQIRVSLAMAMAQNPDLRVIRIAEGSLLDQDNMQLVADMAAEHDFQVWIEIVGNGDGNGIIIEDGEISA